MEGIPVRYKRATAPLDETARARLWSGGDGGSELLSVAEESEELAELVDSFYEGRGEESEWASGSGSGSREWPEMLDSVLAEAGADPAAERIRAEVREAVRVVGSGTADEFKLRVMGRLRYKGLNAGICTSHWDRKCHLPAGCHKYIDVISKVGTRYIVEINLAAEFEIARPTDKYLALLRALPTVFVGRPEVLNDIVTVMCIAAKESMKDASMHIPPWRRREYMQKKWFSSYKRTTNNIFSSAVTGGLSLCRMELARRDGSRDAKRAFAFKGM